jgi:glycosyltransferase involved in cell wall biosynthesis
MRPTISLCMIVKNEARRLGTCLEQASKIVDQLIVVDTGSEDESVQIAEAAGARVYHHPWEGDFSKARNQSLSYATKDWILILDGDEVLDEGSLHYFETLDLSETAPPAYRFQIINFTTERAIEQESGHQEQVRLFKRAPSHGYSGLIHNQLVNIDRMVQLNGPSCPIRVFHYGYIPSVWSAQRKNERLTLLERAIEEAPNSLFAHYNLANHLKILDRHDEAVEHFISALPKETDLSFDWQISACYSGAFCANKIHRYEVALNLTDRALKADPLMVDALLRRVEALIGLDRSKETISLIEEALIDPRSYATKQIALYFYLPYRLGRALYHTQREAEALCLFVALLPRCHDVTVLTHACLCALRLNWDGMFHLLRSIGADIDADDPDWRTVDRLSRPSMWSLSDVSHASTSKPQFALEVRGRDVSLWVDHLREGLLSLKDASIDLSAPAGSIEVIDSSRNEEGQPRSPSLLMTLTTTDRDALLRLTLDGELIYTSPARFISPHHHVTPQESALLCIAHLRALELWTP